MPRKIAFDFDPKDPALWELEDNYKEETIEYHLVTPLFGGGVEPFHPDPLTTVRASEIKGQLRFWWRALRGGKDRDISKLLEREERIWGGIATENKGVSQVQISVRPKKSGTKVELYREGFKNGKKKVFYIKENAHLGHPYLAFPLHQKEKTGKGKERNVLHPVRQGVAFELTLRYPKALEEEVQAALWAWETFGGIGARTRRGFGCVVRSGATPPTEKEIRKKLKHWIGDNLNWPEGVPHLHPDGVFYLFPGSWKELAEKYQNFRQWRKAKRKNRPGRNAWPEPDEIRRITGKHNPRHEPREKNAVHKFPRGQFGLPIVFHFKDAGEPPDTTLQGKSKDLQRLASPLGFKPYSLNGPVLVYVLVGSRELPDKRYGLYENQSKRLLEEVEVKLSPEEAEKIEPLREAGGETDPVLAFIRWLKQKKQQEAKR